MSEAITQTGFSGNTVRVAAPQRSVGAMIAKRIVQSIFGFLGLPRLLCYVVTRGVLGRRAFLASSESISRIPGLRGVYARQQFYRRTLAHCGRDAYFGWLSVFSMHEATVGDRAYIGRFCTIGFADIGTDVMLADHVQILSGGREHGLANGSQTMHDQPQTYERIKIGRGAWIGAGAVVMADVGQGAIIGAGAVVTRPVPNNCLAVGVPARVVRSLDAS